MLTTSIGRILKQWSVGWEGCILEVFLEQAAGTWKNGLWCWERAEWPDDKDGWARTEHARTYPANKHVRRCRLPTVRFAPERLAANRTKSRGLRIRQWVAPSQRSCDVSPELQPMGLKRRSLPCWCSLPLIGQLRSKRLNGKNMIVTTKQTELGQ